jgi:PAS domain S-box-containing protein
MAFIASNPLIEKSLDPKRGPGQGRRGRSAARHLAMIVVGASVVLAGIGGFVADQTWGHAQQQARANAAFQAGLAAHAIEDAVTTGAATLAGLSSTFPTAAVLAHPEGCQLLFAGLGVFPSGHTDVVLPDGRVICSSLAAKGAPEGATQAGASWLSEVTRTKAGLISETFTDRLTGAPAIALVTPLPVNGAVAAMITVVVTLPDLAQGLGAVYAGPRGFAFTVSDAGALLSRPPGVPLTPSGAHDSARLHGSALVESLGWRIDASASEAVILAATRALLLKGAALGLAGLVLIVILLFLVDRWIARPLDRLADTEGRLRVSEERLRLLLNGARDYAIVMLDAEGRVASWSASAELLDGYGEDEIRGRDYSAFFTSEEVLAGRPAEILEQAAATGRTEIEGVRIRRDGSRYWAHSVVTARHDDNGTVHSFVTVTHDVSARRNAEQTIRRMNEELEQRVAERTAELQVQAGQLRAANTELESFSYSISHDLRAPLRAINGFAGSLVEKYGPDLPEGAGDYVQRILHNATTLTDMVNALLSLATTQRTEMRTENLDLEGLVRSAWDELALERAGRSVELSVGTLLPGRGDPRLIRQVVANLLGNALKYTSTRTQATIVVGARKDDQVVYFVQDNGAGFDMRNADRLFKVFQRLHSATEFPGTGIGLASVERIVTRHGGRVWAESTPQQGATFYFTLDPAPEAPGETGAVARESSSYMLPIHP